MPTTIIRGNVAPYALPARPLPVGTSASPVVDLRRSSAQLPTAGGSAWDGALACLQRAAGAGADVTPPVSCETIKPFDRQRGAGQQQLERVLAVLDDGHPVAFYGWWPTATMAATNPTLGVDAMEVPPPDRKGTALVDGHAVVIVGYGRHGAFPGGGYLIVHNSWSRSGWGDEFGDGAMPFAFLRAYATELCTSRGEGAVHHDIARSSERVGVFAGGARLPHVAQRDLVDIEIDKKARCSDGRGSLTELFFSDEPVELARARAICTACSVRDLCLHSALARSEPYGIWGGELLVDGVVVAEKRGRGRPRKVPRPRLVVDEITGAPTTF